jgi:excisionase family DNA binding protein
VTDDPELITIAEARDRLNVSRPTMARLLKEGRFTVYRNPLDRREKLVPVSEIELARRPIIELRPQDTTPKKLAA